MLRLYKCVPICPVLNPILGNNIVDAQICAGETESCKILVIIPDVSQLFVPLLKVKLLPKLWGSYDSD
jgi:hypothetical protein